MAWKKDFNRKAAPPKPDFANVASPLFYDRYGNSHDSLAEPLPIKERLGAFAVIVAHGHILLNFPPWAEYCKQEAGASQLCAELPGGGVKLEETVETGLLRELQEETGLSFPPGQKPNPVHANEFYMNLFAEDVDTYYRYLQKFYYYELSDYLSPSGLTEGTTEEGSKRFWQKLDTLDELTLRFGHEHIIREAAIHECKPEKIRKILVNRDSLPVPKP